MQAQDVDACLLALRRLPDAPASHYLTCEAVRDAGALSCKVAQLQFQRSAAGAVGYFRFCAAHGLSVLDVGCLDRLEARVSVEVVECKLQPTHSLL